MENFSNYLNEAKEAVTHLRLSYRTRNPLSRAFASPTV